MILTLAFRHLWVRKLRALFLLLGFALGVGVMIVLLSVGEAMLAQSRDVALVGGGEVTVLPQGIDVEAMRSGGLSGMFFGIDRARFVARQLLGGPRNADVVRSVAPAIENKVVYLGRGGTAVPLRVGGEIPSRARAVGTGLDVVPTARPTRPTSRPRRSSSTTSSTTSTFRSAPTRPGASGNTSTSSPGRRNGGT
jgi:ABC-type lipoprotein release transport system permease subunit